MIVPGLIRGLISQSCKNAQDVETVANVLGGQVHALARAPNQITAKNWGPGSFKTLIATEAGAYLGDVDWALSPNGNLIMT